MLTCNDCGHDINRCQCSDWGGRKGSESEARAKAVFAHRCGWWGEGRGNCTQPAGHAGPHQFAVKTSGDKKPPERAPGG